MSGRGLGRGYSRGADGERVEHTLSLKYRERG
jgi:hypothetical protein